MLCFFAQFHSGKVGVVYYPYSNKAEGSQKKKNSGGANKQSGLSYTHKKIEITLLDQIYNHIE